MQISVIFYKQPCLFAYFCSGYNDKLLFMELSSPLLSSSLNGDCCCHTLANGLRLIYRPLQSPVAYCGFAIDVGTRDEQESEHGMAHLVEHLLFKGTTRRRAWHILNRMESVGGDLNAYTNKEETVVYAAFLAGHFNRAAELLTDIVFHSTFPVHEMEKEREVVIDEIHVYEDSPAELIFDDFEDRIFCNHPLGHNILGCPEALRGFTRQDVLAFVNRHYRPERMVFFVLGAVDFRRVVRQMERLTADLGNRLVAEAPSAAAFLRQPPAPYQPCREMLHRHTSQVHVMLGGRGYAANDNRRTDLYLLNNLLGGPGMNSRLNLSLRERRGLVYNVESNLVSYTDTGMFSIYFGCDAADYRRCLSLVQAELKRLRERKLTSSQLAAAKKQLIGQIGVAQDNNENIALGMGKSYLHYNRCEPLSVLFARIEALTSDGLLEVANECFHPDNLSLLTYE